MSVKRSPTSAAGFLAALVGVAVAVVLLSGCGGSGAAEATANGTTVKGAAPSGSSDYIVKSRDEVTKSEGATEIETGRFPHGQDTDEVSVTGTKPIKPCTLVARVEANRILGGNVKISEHLQGPTCVFSGSGREISLVIMEVALKPLVAGARSSHALKIGGHSAWCLRYETTSMVTALGSGRVLQVTGPCPAGARFTAAALPRIPA
jgi:hypothetical protein